MPGVVLAGLASVAFGVLIMAGPGAGALAVLWLIASYAVIFGVRLAILAFEVEDVGKRIEARLLA